MNQGIPLSWGCTGNALSNQRSIDDEETTQAYTASFNRIRPCQINQEKEKKLSQSRVKETLSENPYNYKLVITVPDP